MAMMLTYLSDQIFHLKSYKNVIKIISERGIMLNADTDIDCELDGKYVYIYNAFLNDSIDDELPTLPQLNPCQLCKNVKN